MIKKILIANRGEIAFRIIRACREMGIKSVAVYSKADKDSLPVRFADEAVCIGKPASKDSYLNIPNILAAAEITNADAIHPGYGFLAENGHFADICQKNKITFIGPTGEMIEKMGDKSTAKKIVSGLGLPTVPGSKGLLESVEEARTLAKKVGYPVLFKATAGGGGKGMRIVQSPEGLESAWEDASKEALNAFGNAGLYMEKFVEEPRHIEIQVFGDAFGNALHMCERDCSIQRRHQKLIEEAPSPIIDPKLRAKMAETALAIVKGINYLGAGTVEFLVDKYHNYYFMEMNTRVQVEHCVTEQILNTDIIRQQILVAQGERLPKRNYKPQAWSIECRINAEDPYRNFAPSPGQIKSLHFPSGLGVRVDSHIYQGYQIPPYYDSMVAKIIVTAPDRTQAIRRMDMALCEFVIEGIKTTAPFLRQVINSEAFMSGNFTTKFLDTWKPQPHENIH